MIEKFAVTVCASRAKIGGRKGAKRIFAMKRDARRRMRHSYKGNKEFYPVTGWDVD